MLRIGRPAGHRDGRNYADVSDRRVGALQHLVGSGRHNDEVGLMLVVPTSAQAPVEAYVCDVGVSRRVALEVIGAVLTHSSPSSTLIYTHLTAEDLRRVLADRGVLDRVADLLL